METAGCIAAVRGHKEVLGIIVILKTAKDTTCAIAAGRAGAALVLNGIAHGPQGGIVEHLAVGCNDFVISVKAFITYHN